MRYLILGCGWVGEYVARLWIAEGHEVWASTTSSEKYHRLLSDGIFAFVHNFDDDNAIPDNFPESFDYILVSIPATKRHSEDILVKRFDRVFGFVSGLTYNKLIFLSSVGIYPDISGDMFENGWESNQLDAKLLSAEESMRRLSGVIVYRLGGLFGQERIFAKYFQHKVCTTGGQLCNFVHLEDVAALIRLGFDSDLTNGLYNVVTPAHPLKHDVILASARKYGFAVPEAFRDEDSFQKKVHGSLLQDELNYTFKFPSPLDF